MDTLASDQIWGVITMLVSTAIGLALALVLIAVVNSRHLKQGVRLTALFFGFAAYLLWLFTLGDPKSSVSLESLYQKSMTRQMSHHAQ